MNEKVPASAADDGHTHETACLNCGTTLVGSHCHACGQAAHVHRTLGAFFHDLLHGVFHFEGRIWRTLPMLAWRPGDLTRRYVAGERARFVSPLALFLFAVFLMFAVMKQTAGEITPQTKIDADGKAQVVGNGEINSVSSDVPVIDHALQKFKANPGLALYKVQTYAYKYSWLLIPISVPFVWLLFPFSRRFHLYDHTVFVTYSISFMTILATVLMLASLAHLPGLAIVALLVPPLHLYRQVRGAYGVSRFGALWRTLALGIVAFAALALFALFVLAETGA
ncbi:DUF3667 domain-containing protein [Novosphingobium sp. NBM11]|uniref:DUF3667 domain-containing protein n=1 Tax=unclassified Novosphingobium TaxID=2644732 RepID=UPI00061CBD13|nr:MULTISPECIES: DUF3667 domain-containing protein [unclassified Novosphingobium]MBF5090321.1 DUF3667 domain-containing protein [Novosphingobium sp. NBM11]GAO54308.1 hypothetical protein NMD1_01404 [Novosphingobium sp. MD-1]